MHGVALALLQAARKQQVPPYPTLLSAAAACAELSQPCAVQPHPSVEVPEGQHQATHKPLLHFEVSA
jgi:hypothetical protein